MGRALTCLLLLAAATGCLDPGQPPDAGRACAAEFVDSLGEVFPKADGICRPTIGEASPRVTCGGDATPSVTFGWGRFYEACPGCDDASLRTDCRPLVCDTDEDCPYFPNKRLVGEELETFTEEFECRNGLCQNIDLERHPDDLLDPIDAQLLCLGTLARGEVYAGPDPCPAAPRLDEGPCPLPLPDPCLQP